MLHGIFVVSSYLPATQPILLEAYFQISRGIKFFSTKLFFPRIAFKELEKKIIKVRPLCFCLATIPVFFVVVFLKDGQLFAKEYSILFMEVSAFTGMNVDNLFSKIGTFTLNVLINMRYWPSVRSGWIDIGQVLFLRFYWRRRSRGQ